MTVGEKFASPQASNSWSELKWPCRSWLKLEVKEPCETISSANLTYNHKELFFSNDCFRATTKAVESLGSIELGALSNYVENKFTGSLRQVDNIINITASIAKV